MTSVALSTRVVTATLVKRNYKKMIKSTRTTQSTTATAMTSNAACSKGSSRDSSPDISSKFAALTLEERETKARNEIAAMELEERVAQLREKRDAMHRRRAERIRKEELQRRNAKVYRKIMGRMRVTLTRKDLWK